MTTITTIELSNVVGGQQLAHRTPQLNAPADFLPPGLRPDQLTMDQFKESVYCRLGGAGSFNSSQNKPSILTASVNFARSTGFRT
jgi:hypothetical protein